MSSNLVYSVPFDPSWCWCRRCNLVGSYPYMERTNVYLQDFGTRTSTQVHIHGTSGMPVLIGSWQSTRRGLNPQPPTWETRALIPAPQCPRYIRNASPYMDPEWNILESTVICYPLSQHLQTSRTPYRKWVWNLLELTPLHYRRLPRAPEIQFQHYW